METVADPSNPGAGGTGAAAAIPALRFHDVRIPVSDALVSKEWYITVLGMVPVLDLEWERGVVGVVLRHPEGFVVGLHHEPERAEALRGFAVLGLAVDGYAELQQWFDVLDRLDVPHGPIEEGHLGWYVDVPDPDGIVVRIHTEKGTAPDAEEA